MPGASDILLKLSTELLKKWAKDGVSKGELPALPEMLREGLEQLQKGGYLATKLPTSLADAIPLAIKAIQLFQQVDRNVSTDGVLRTGLLRWLNAAPLCPINQDHDESKVTPLAPNAKRDQYTIRYFIDSSVDAAIGGGFTSDLIAEAWQMWSTQCEHLDVTWVTSPGEANVIVVMKQIDGNGGVLGRAPLCGPGKFKDCTVTMDKTEMWDARLFRVAICHEFGHVLGLGHSPHSGDLMSPIIGQGIAAPTANDVQRIQRLFGRAEFAPVPTPPFVFTIPR